MALKVHDKDNVATVFDHVQANTVVEVIDKKKNIEKVTVSDEIPYGHKFCLSPVKKGEEIIKYGEAIGLATCDIAMGQHVHVHNLESARGRGDWQKEGQA